MKHLVLTKILGIGLFLAFSLPALAQFPNINGKLVQGKQTTAQGIVSYSDTLPLHTPTAATWRYNTLSHVDTTFGIVYQWRYPRWYAISTIKQSTPPPATVAAGSNFVDYTETLWQNSLDSTTYYYEEKQLCWEPVGTVVRDTTPVSTAATGTSAAVCYEYSLWYNSTNDSLYAYTGATWIKVGAGTGGGGGGMTSFNFAGTSGTPQTITDGNTATVAAGYGVTTTAGATDQVTVEVDTAQIATQYDLSVVADSAAVKPSGTGTNLRIPLWTGTASLGSSTLLQSATGQTLDANLAFRITGGTTASRPTGAAGMMYWNTSNGWLDIHNGTSWFNPLRSATNTGLGTAQRVFFADATTGAATTASDLVYRQAEKYLGVGIYPIYPIDVLGTGNVIGRFASSATDYAQFLMNSGGNMFMIPQSGAGKKAGFVFSNSTTLKWAVLNDGADSDKLKFNYPDQAGTNYFSLLTTGFAGFGTATPASRMTVSGNASIGSGYAATAAPTNGAIIEGTVGIGNSSPQRKLHVTGEARITDLTTDPPTQIVGADADGDLGAVTLGAGLSFSSGTLNGAFLPLTLTGTTEVNTAGQILRIRDAGGYPDVYMNSNYWLAASDVNTFVDVGSTSGQFQINAASRIYAASAGTLEIQAASEMRIDADSLVLDGVYPVGTSADSVLVRDGATGRVNLRAQTDILPTLFTGGANPIQDQTFPYIAEGEFWGVLRETGDGDSTYMGVIDKTIFPENPAVNGQIGQGIYGSSAVGEHAGIEIGTDGASAVAAMYAIDSDSSFATISLQAYTTLFLNYNFTADSSGGANIDYTGLQVNGALTISDTENGDGAYIAAISTGGKITRAGIAGNLEFTDGALTTGNNLYEVADTITRTLGVGQQVYSNGYAAYSGSNMTYASGRVTNASGSERKYKIRYYFTALTASGPDAVTVKVQIWDGATYTEHRAGRLVMTLPASVTTAGSKETIITLPDGDGVNISFDSANSLDVSNFGYVIEQI